MMRIETLACAWLLLAGGCSSKKKSTPQASPPPVEAAGSAASDVAAPPPIAAAATGSDAAWDEPPPPPVKRANIATDDPDAVITRYTTECPKGGTAGACKDLRLAVEWVLLQDTIGLRAAGQQLDRQWYRVAARAETPQLACIGVTALASVKDRTPEDDAALVAALENPSHSVRDVAFATQVPPIVELLARARLERTSSGTCVDGQRDSEPSSKWAGGYPGARFRYLASGPSLRWFTTSDPVEKVLEYFNKSGRPAMTADELSTAAQTKFVQEAQRLTLAAKPGEEAKLTAQLQELAVRMNPDWGSEVRRQTGIGEIRYVMITPNQVIAIFKDDVFHATSIVAQQPADPPSLVGTTPPAKAPSGDVYYRF